MLAKLVRATRAFFRDDIRLQVQGGKLRVHLESPDGPYVPPEERLRLAAEKRAAEDLLIMRRELAAMLDDDPGARARLPHLAFVEQQLAIQGLALLDKLSVALLRAAYKQLDDNVMNWSQVGLATLRSKLGVAVKERGLGHGQDTAEADAALPSDPSCAPAMEVQESPLADNEQALLDAYRAMREGSGGVGDNAAPGVAATDRVAA